MPKSHFLLLFGKNLKLLVRAPITLLFEFLVPLIVLLLFFGISQSFSTTHHCFSTFSSKSNAIPLPATARIAVAPNAKIVQDIINQIFEQQVSLLTSDNFEYLGDADYVNDILEVSPAAYTAALLFDGLSWGDDALPHNISYTIRYPIVTAGGTVDWNSKNPGPYEWKCSSGIGFCLGDKTPSPMLFLQSGQFQLQQAVDRAIIRLKTGLSYSEIPETKGRQLPFPDWVENWFLVGLSESLPMMIVIGYFWNVFISTRDFVRDRDNGVREIFKSIGVRNSSILSSAYLVRIIVGILVATFSTFAVWLLQIVRFSNFFLVWLIIVLFAISAVHMCFLMGTFTRTSTLGMFTILICYICTFAPFLVLAQDTAEHSEVLLWIFSLLSPTAGSLALHNVGLWEAHGIGLTWDTLNQAEGPNGFTALSAITMLIVDIILYGALFVYLDGIFPGKHGIGLHWGYICDPRYWRGDNPAPSEKSSTTGEILRGIVLRNLEKHYFQRGRIVQAVNGISAHFRENEIATLLGYNGSGKTTTLKMLAAMHSPTRGEIVVNGMDLAVQNNLIRKTLGYCPQHNILIEDLTVEEHLQLFVSLKGLHERSREREVEMSLKKLGFLERRTTLVQYLSGGMKRKLSLGLALCGHPAVVVLDEPTCGMDAEARKVTWDLLLSHKKDRTIVVSTHDMEEADLLSDRCFVLSDGYIIASGSAVNIKKQNGMGYQLSLSLMRPTHQQVTLPLLQQFVPGVKLLRKNYKEHIYTINDYDRGSLINLMNYLENEGKDDLDVMGYGLMQSDLEEALVNVVQRQHSSRPIEPDDLAKLGCFASLQYYICGARDDLDTVFTNTTRRSTLSRSPHKPTPPSYKYKSSRYSGVALSIHRMRTLVYKRWLDSKRNKAGICMKFVIPALLVLFSVIFLQINRSSTPIKYTLDISGLSKDGQDTVLVAAQSHNDIVDVATISHLVNQYQNVRVKDWSQDVWRESERDTSNCCNNRFLQLSESCASLSWNDTQWSECRSNATAPFGYQYCFEGCFQRDVLYGNQGCPPGRTPGDGQAVTWIDHFQNLFLNRSKSYTFQKYHHHVLSSAVDENGALQLNGWSSSFRGFSLPQSLNLLNNVLLQHLTNSSAQIKTSFWPYKTLADNLTQSSQVSLPLIIFAIFTTFAATFITASFSLFLVKERVCKMKYLQLMNGISGRIYWYANFFWDYLTFVIFALFVIVLLMVFGINEYTGEFGLALFLLLLLFGLASLPITYLTTKLIDNAALCFAALCSAGFAFCLCGIMITLYVESTHVRSLLALIPYSALGIGLVDLYVSHNLASYHKICGECLENTPSDAFSTDSGGVGMQLLCLAIEGIVLTVLLIATEELSVFAQLYFNREDIRGATYSRDHGADADCERERKKIGEVNSSEQYPVIVSSICKDYSDTVVVNDVSFGMKRGQCVGLLGPNGAGKSTLFSILSGETVPTYGNVSLFGTDMLEDIRGYRQRVGYCPQDPATFTNLTGREILAMFAGLRGITEGHAPEFVARLLAWTGLTRYADRTSGTYSGGTLRKLSLAISLIGDPPVLLLDEPSASVDPTSRRLMWKLLRQLVDSGKSVLVSTHIKGEVETLCDKVVVLTKGEMTAVGPCTQVRDKFGAGFCLQVSTVDPSEVDLTKAALEHRLSDVKLVHRVGRHLQYFVPHSSYTYSQVFVAVELLKHLVKLDHYSVSQLAFSQLDFMRRFSDTAVGDNLFKKIHGFVRRSFRRGSLSSPNELRQPGISEVREKSFTSGSLSSSERGEGEDGDDRVTIIDLSLPDKSDSSVKERSPSTEGVEVGF